jgi:orotidine-5'-phosphate decarboxylase
MMQAAVESARKAALAMGRPKPKVIGVTLLTSLSEQHLREFLFVESASVTEYVQHLALQAKKCGLDGVVCSAQEAASIREVTGQDFLLVTPGIRPSGAGEQDQLRVITPSQALKNGSDYLVVGRPITGSADPYEAAQKILDEMQGALA